MATRRRGSAAGDDWNGVSPTWSVESELAARRVVLAAEKVASTLRKAGFYADQPRDDRGRWTDTGAGDGEAGGEVDPELILVGGAHGGAGRPVDLLDEEAAGGHTVKQHVAKSDQYLLARIRGEQGQFGIFTVSRRRVGTFTSVEAANKLVNSTLAENAETVAAVAGVYKNSNHLTVAAAN